MRGSIAKIAHNLETIRILSDFELAFAGRLYTLCVVND